jgi:hypothetical protein
MNLYKPAVSEEFRTILNAIIDMPEVKRHEFYKSTEGKAILKGLEMEDTSVLPDGAEHQMDQKELDELWEKFYHSSVEQRNAIIQMLPGPVVSVLLNNLAEKAKEPDINERAVIKGMAGAPSVPSGGMGRGPRKGSQNYYKWLEGIRASRAAKKLANAGSHPNKKEGFKKRNYKHFVRKVGEHAEISDSPSGSKE